MSDDVFLISDNIAIVQAHDSGYLVPPTISVQELPEYYGTVSLQVVQSKAIVADQYQYVDIKMLFGSWIESGDEDKQLEELYKSRLVSSK